MAQVNMFFTVKASKEILGAIHSMAVAIEDEGFYGAEFEYEEGGSSFEANVENLDLEDLLGWVAIFQMTLLENGYNRFAFTIEGTADNDYDSFTVFQIKCTDSAVSKKEKEFEIDIDEDVENDFIAREEAIWDAKEENLQDLNLLADEIVVDVEFDMDEFGAANDALIEYLEDELESEKSIFSDSATNYEPENEFYFNQVEQPDQAEKSENKWFRKIADIRENLVITDLNSNPFDSFIGEMEVKGTAYEGRSERIEYLKVGDSVQLVREPDNAQYSLNISVRNQHGESLGNLEKEFCDAFAPLIDEGILKFREASVLSVEPLSKRGPSAKKAELYISLIYDFDQSIKDNSCLVYLVGGDQTNIWTQKIKAFVCMIPVSHMKMIFEIYNRYCDEYNVEKNDVSYLGLDNLAEEVTKARAKMRSEMDPMLNYEPVDEESKCFCDYLINRITEESERYQALMQYMDIFDQCWNDDDAFYMDELFDSFSLGFEENYWIDQTKVSETEFSEYSDEYYENNHWYEVAEVFDLNEWVFNFEDEDTIGIFGSDKFKAVIDLSYGC